MREKNQRRLVMLVAFIILAIGGSVVIAASGSAQPLFDDPTPLPVTPTVTPIYNTSVSQVSPAQVTGVDMVLVIDRSGSISGGKIADAKSAAQQFVDLMDLSKDQVGLVSFSSSATLDHQLSQDAESVKAAIGSLTAGGGTAIDDGILEAQGELESVRHIAANAPGMIVLSNGKNNAGPDPVIQAANQAKQAGTRIFTIGVGADADEDTLIPAASSPDDYYFAPTSGDLADIYAKIAGGVRPSPQGDLKLHLPPRLLTTQPLIVDTTVFNSGSRSTTYSVTVTLKGSSAISQTKNPSHPAHRWRKR